MDFRKWTEEIWKAYLLGDTIQSYEDIFSKDCVIIGTGKHEFYQTLHEFLDTLDADLSERANMNFQFRDYWCEQKQLTEDLCLVYGTLFVWWENEERTICVNMDSRFTVLYQRFETQWKIVHVHQSMPNIEQKDGEFYPKTMTEQVKKEQEEKKLYEDLANRDALTGLLNFKGFEKMFSKADKRNSWLLVIDLDDFKLINDRYGHIEGNTVLKNFANVLVDSVRAEDLVCRMGGDEFLLFCQEVKDEDSVRSLINRIYSNVENQKQLRWHGMSVGITSIHPEDTLESAFQRADNALYTMKDNGKNDWQIIG